MDSVPKRINIETRRYPRNKCEATVEWSFLHKDIYSVSKLLNFSKGGVYFETDHDLKPGTTIFLKMNAVSSIKVNSIDKERPRSVSLGEVQWRIALPERHKKHYGVGLRYPKYPFPT